MPETKISHVPNVIALKASNKQMKALQDNKDINCPAVSPFPLYRRDKPGGAAIYIYIQYIYIF